MLSYKTNNYDFIIDDEQKKYIKTIVEKYADSTDAIMKIAAYRTKPMRYILEQEKTGRNMTKIPVLYKNESVLDVDNKEI